MTDHGLGSPPMNANSGRMAHTANPVNPATAINLFNGAFGPFMSPKESNTPSTGAMMASAAPDTMLVIFGFEEFQNQIRNIFTP